MIKFVHSELEQDFYWQNKIKESFNTLDFANLIDSTLLKPSATKSEINKLCEDALSAKFRSVCVPPCYTKEAKLKLKNSVVKVCTVLGFPLGYTSTAAKVEEMKSIMDSVDEFDFVQNNTFVKNSEFNSLEKEYLLIVENAKDKLVKVILETALLSTEEIYKCTLIAAKCGIHVIKTSTGFSSRGASLQDIEVIKNALNAYQQETGNVVGIKASGGVRSIDDAFAFVQAGATRLGTSGGNDIIKGKLNNSNY
ncbi:deoxyribose-phosphate aldolase [Pigmentibacter sp. JX0631]|uniref:deoxyribose-phosphate aldolase n=1 Tax=Pigmentibacter sp. JX0631 TaxID=2976982 RepID=UPI002468FA73|nr:deoxyribose-phosphate aldolase [Pigmentibacter sp. JX0631]WGL60342.1 deoxyribose-phosphate aldolase [Pigmentibacter sp. JX0631]